MWRWLSSVTGKAGLASARRPAARAARARAKPRRWTTLHWALLISVALHAGLLTFRFVAPERFERAFRHTPLEVILVNARSTEAPTQPTAVAQAALAGGGEADSGRATSPLPATAQVELGEAAQDARRRVDHLADQQRQLLAQIRREMATLAPPDPQRDTGNPTERDQDERRRHLLKLLAEIEKRINEDSARPRKRYISPSTSEAVYAIYYDQLRRRIEDRGTRDFPEFRGKKLYGDLTMNITVDTHGQVIETEIVRSSGSKVLDQRALAIVVASAPFGLFNVEMRQQADQIVITSRFRFTREDGVEASMLANPN